MTGPHLDDQDLSAHLDGEAGHGAHLRGCGVCAGRLDELRQASAMVAEPVAPLPAGSAEHLVSVAVNTGLRRERLQRLGPEGAGGGQPPAPRRGLRPPVGALAVAAMAVVALAVVAVLVGRASDGDDLVASSPPGGEPRSGDLGASDEAGLAYIGEFQDPAVLASTLRATLDGEALAAGDAMRQEATVERAPAEGGAAAQEAGPPMAATGAGPGCVEEARRVGGERLLDVLYRARLDWKGQPAVALVFALRDDGPEPRQLYVMADPGCAVLAERRL